MFRLLLILLIFCGCGSSSNSDSSYVTNVGQGPVKVYLTNQSPYPGEKMPGLVQALNLQLQQDLKPIWGIDAQAVWADPPEGARSLRILPDFSSQPRAWHKCTGFHTTGTQGYVDFAECENELVFTVTVSHEILEMLTNPNVSPTGYEICDPVDSRNYAYAPTGTAVMVSDFVFPRFYMPASPGPWDMTGQVREPLRPAPGGQIFAQLAAAGKLHRWACKVRPGR